MLSVLCTFLILYPIVFVDGINRVMFLTLDVKFGLLTVTNLRNERNNTSENFTLFHIKLVMMKGKEKAHQ